MNFASGSFTLSSYTVTTTAGGNAPQTSAAALASITAANPYIVEVPLDLNTILSDDNAQINLTLVDTNSPANTVKVASFSPDLSLWKSLKAYQAQALALQQDKQSLQAEVNSNNTQLQNLIKQLSPAVLTTPTTDLIGDTAIILHFATDVYSKVQVTNTTITKTYPADVGTDHRIRIDGLSPQTQYTFEVVALNAAGNPIPAMTQKITVTTKASVPLAPVLTLSASNPTTVKATVNFDPAMAFPANFKTYCTLQYRLVIDATSATYGPWQSTGDGQLDSLGVPQGTPFTSSHDFQISGTSSKQYQVNLTAYNEYGQKFTSLNPAQITLPTQPPSFDFSGPINVTLNTQTGITVVMSANASIASANMDIVFGDGYKVDFPTSTQTISDKTATLNSGNNGLVNAVAAVQTKKSSPIINVTMTGKDGSVKTQSFSLTFVVAGAPAGAPPAVAAANTQLQQVTANPNGKIKWSDVLAAGLSFIVKAL